MTRAEWVAKLGELAAREGVAKFGRDKYYIAALERAAQKDRALHRVHFRQELLEAHREGLLQLARADLPAVMDRKLVAESALHPVAGMDAVYHLVAFQAWGAKRTPTEAKREARAAERTNWEELARYFYALACAAMNLDAGPSAPKVPKAVQGDPVAACDAIVVHGASALRPRAHNPARMLTSPEEAKRALRAYRVTHWGEKGTGAIAPMRCPDPRRGPLVALGRLRDVTYETTKGGDPPGTFYTHAFKRPLPELAYGPGGLVICDGEYRVDWRGIVG